MVSIKLARLRGGQALFRELQHFEHDRAARSERTDLVAHPEWVTGTHGLLVHAHVTGRAGFLSKSARLVESRRYEPLVDADGGCGSRRGDGSGGVGHAKFGFVRYRVRPEAVWRLFPLEAEPRDGRAERVSSGLMARS